MKTLVLVGVLLTLAAPAIAARGINLNWGTVCYTEAPMSALTFACDTNAGNSVITVSFAIGTEMADMIAVEFEIVGESTASSLPDWWKIGAAPDCRSGQVQFSDSITAVETETPCTGWPGNGRFMATQYGWYPGAAGAHASMGVAIDWATPFDMQPGIEYYAGQITVLHGRTVGVDACTGCSTGMVWGLNSVLVHGFNSREDRLWDPLPGGNQCLTWNNAPQHWCVTVPTRTTTWGQIKSMYR
jgi:hypothetical protein